MYTFSIQEQLDLTLTGAGYTLEFIRHSDHHHHIYINGQKSDVIFPRHEEFFKNMRRYKIFKRLIFGQSKYNKEIVKKVFMDIVPEEFL